MNGPLWFVVDGAGIQYSSHHSEAEALLAVADKYAELPPESNVEFLAEPGSADGPWAYAVPHRQRERR
jgi:hypothetical protein